MSGRMAALSDAVFVRSRGLYLLTGPGGQCDRYRMNGNDVEWIDSTPLIRGAEPGVQSMADAVSLVGFS